METYYNCCNCGGSGEDSELNNSACPDCYNREFIVSGLPSAEIAENYYTCCACGGFVLWVSDNKAMCSECGYVEHDGGDA